MANRSQCPDDDAHRGRHSSASQMYSEVQRLALEELLAAGHVAFHAFLRREKARVFLSEPEICAILRAAARPPGAEEKAAAAAEERDGSGNASCRLSLAYFPVRSDLEPPAPELGWPTPFGSRRRRRGPAEVEAFFQPGFGETVYPCKEAVRKQICLAKEVIAIVMDIFTDIDIFSDLLEACQKRRVRVYILLDETFFLYFLKMCHDFGIDLEDEKLLRVRSITGKVFYTRSGIKLVGKAHEKFMLVDNIRVTTGSYSFTWTDGNLSSSNIVMLSGCAVAQFELRFWILYAQSKCSNAKRLVIYKNYKSEQFSRKAKPSNTLSIINVKRMDFFHLRTLSANVLNKHELLQLSRDTRYKSNIVIKMSPEFTKTNQSLFLTKTPTVKIGFISETYCAKCLQCD